MITVKRLVARLKQIERMGDTDASKRRAVLSTPLCERVASSQAENEVPAKIRILRLLDRNILPHEKVIDAYPELSEPVKRIIRKMLDRDHWLIGHWWGGYFPHVALLWQILLFLLQGSFWVKQFIPTIRAKLCF